MTSKKEKKRKIYIKNEIIQVLGCELYGPLLYKHTEECPRPKNWAPLSLSHT